MPAAKSRYSFPCASYSLQPSPLVSTMLGREYVCNTYLKRKTLVQQRFRCGPAAIDKCFARTNVLKLGFRNLLQNMGGMTNLFSSATIDAVNASASGIASLAAGFGGAMVAETLRRPCNHRS